MTSWHMTSWNMTSVCLSVWPSFCSVPPRFLRNGNTAPNFWGEEEYCQTPLLLANPTQLQLVVWSVESLNIGNMSKHRYGIWFLSGYLWEVRVAVGLAEQPGPWPGPTAEASGIFFVVLNKPASSTWHSSHSGAEMVAGDQVTFILFICCNNLYF